jgi:hypothetical protein
LTDRQQFYSLFPEIKKQQRITLVRTAAEYAAASVSRKIADAHHLTGAVASNLGDRRLATYVDEYVERVIDFKIGNDIGPVDRIEAPKIAAILIALLHAKPIEDLFRLDSKLGNGPYGRVVRGTFFNRLVYGCLGLEKGFVNTSIGQDLLSILVTEDVGNQRIMAVLLKGIFQKHGNEDYCLMD